MHLRIMPFNIIYKFCTLTSTDFVWGTSKSILMTLNLRIKVVIVLIDISNFVMSGGILFEMLVLGINEMMSCLSSEVLKGYSLFLIYKTNIFVKLLKLI